MPEWKYNTAPDVWPMDFGMGDPDRSEGVQEQRFIDLVLRNTNNAEILARLPHLGLPDCQLVAGCLFQTVWNGLSGQSPSANILDYDVFYYDGADLGWEAEDHAIRQADRYFSDLGIQIQVRNQARVHIWYQQRFGIPCEALVSTHDAINSFLNRSSCFGLRPNGPRLEVYAPFGFDDLFSMVVRPNPRRDLPSVYLEKANRWRDAWPNLRILPWVAGN